MNFDHLWQRHEMEIDIGNLQKGIYMIELKTCSKSIVNKLVVL
jgi:hypothetical protein